MKNGKIKRMVGMAFLIAMIIVLQLIGGIIPPIGGVSISLVLIPIVVGAAVFGPSGGAILGAARGEEALPKLWREELESAEVLRELAEDMYRGCPMMKGSQVFDIEWDAKYVCPEL